MVIARFVLPWDVMELPPSEGDPGLPEDPIMREAYENIVGRYSELYDAVYAELYDRACFDALENGNPLPAPDDLEAVKAAREKMFFEVRLELWYRERARALEIGEKYADASRIKKISMTIRKWLRQRGY